MSPTSLRHPGGARTKGNSFIWLLGMLNEACPLSKLMVAIHYDIVIHREHSSIPLPTTSHHIVRPLLTQKRMVRNPALIYKTCHCHANLAILVCAFQLPELAARHPPPHMHERLRPQPISDHFRPQQARVRYRRTSGIKAVAIICVGIGRGHI